ncbi:unnamed protein product [Protopolystoma xenopodis]|uniref:Uncharacterized protein n=1 Tax=Protopolystoma xenopodis TaxID=117903 RepID=A0A3S5BC76_9PLAT|nr:unnamed protein product [Protopolystoma xenopodis]
MVLLTVWHAVVRVIVGTNPTFGSELYVLIAFIILYAIGLSIFALYVNFDVSPYRCLLDRIEHIFAPITNPWAMWDFLELFLQIPCS